MRRKLCEALTLNVLLLTLIGAGPQNALAFGTEAYTWENVRIDGGGFVPGIIFNESEPDLIYARTDIGGAYRWDPANARWIPLLDWIGWENWGWNGVLSLATDPVQTDRVYVLAGMYTNDWDPNNGAVLRSTDRGATWLVTELPFKVGGNMPGRGMGERLTIDPNDNSILYLGAMNGHGLWRSEDYGETWSVVEAFPNPGNWSEDPEDEYDYLSAEPGIVWVTFDAGSGVPGGATQDIYVGVADLENTVYRSTDAGATWERLADQPTGFIAHKGQIDSASGALYIATSDNGGPYAGSHGDVWRYDIATSVWTLISPTPSTDTANNWYGYSGLSLDRQSPGTLMVTGYSSWWPDTYIFRSTDSGATWQSFYDMAYPSRTNHYTQDISASPWLSFGTNAVSPEVSPKLGWMTEALAIDPHNSDRFMYGTGATIYGATNLTDLDSGGTVAITTMVEGLEETAIVELVSPPAGDAFLFSGMFDIGGFRHVSLDTAPELMYQQPYLGANTGIDFAELNTVQMVRVGSGDEGVSHIAYSWGSGSSWYQGSEPADLTGGGQVALAADGSNVVWSTEGAGVQYAAFGGSFTAVSGLPAGAQVRSDRVSGNRFYAFAAGTFYTSTDGGASFVASSATGLPTDAVKFKAVPGFDGHIWLTGDTGLYRSTDAGATFSAVAGVDASRNVGFGMAASGASYPAIYLVGTLEGVAGVFRSNDEGASFVRINDDAHQYGNMGEAITGDPRLYGRVYLGTNGRGILYADPAGEPDTEAPTAPGTPVPSNITTSTVDLVWEAATDSGGSGLAGYDVIDAVGTVLGRSSATSLTLVGLTSAATYEVRVRARDGAGNLSAVSAAASFTTAEELPDTTAPSVPTSVVVFGVTADSAEVSWDAATDEGGSGVAGYRVYLQDGGVDVLAGETAETTFSLTDLASGSVYSVAVLALDGAGNTSSLSTQVSFATAEDVLDTMPPTAPGTPTAANVTASSVDLSWAASTDEGGSGLAGYEIYLQDDGVETLIGEATSPGMTLSGLNSSTVYTVVVRAVDGAGNASSASGAVTFTTASVESGAACTATYTTQPPWPGGFQGAVNVENTGSTPLSGWTVTWAYLDGQTITQLWGGIAAATGPGVTVVNEAWNGALGVGGTASFGFIASWNSTSNTDPVDVLCMPN